MRLEPEGNAIIYCQGSFGIPNGKTAHGLVRQTRRYRVLSVIDSHHAGLDAGEVLDGTPKRIPIYADTRSAIEAAKHSGAPATHFVIGLAPDGGKLSAEAREAVREAITAALAKKHGVRLRDVRKPPPRDRLHFFTGRIEEVDSLKVALLGTDSAVGKRTTAWAVLEALQDAGFSAELIGTGQTAWMQGVRYGLILDSLVNDFVTGEIEHAIYSAWKNHRPNVILIEGQGSLLNPAYPGGFEILAAARPDLVLLQHAPARKDYDGFPGHPIHPLEKQIQAVELISGKPVAAVTINHEGIVPERVPAVCQETGKAVGRPAMDVLLQGAGQLVELLRSYLKG